MKTKFSLISHAALLLLPTLICQLSTSPAHAQGTAFTYQGRLNSGTNPANGSYDVSFALFGVSAGGSPIAGPATNVAVAVSNGLFTTVVNLGNPFTGASNWLQIAVSTNGANAFFTLAPRQQLTPTPYAIYAETANAANLTGTLTGSGTSLTGVALLVGGNTFAGNQSFLNKVGIGTTTPFTQLANTGNNIFGTDGFGLGVQSLGWSANQFGYIAGFYNSFSATSAGGGLVVGIAGTAARILDLNAAGNSVMVVNGNGRVGIGTNTPANTLDVQGSADFSGSVGIGTTTPKHTLDVNGNLFFGKQANGQVFTELGDTLYLGSSRKYLGNTLGVPVDGSTDWINLMAHPFSQGIMFGLSGPSDADPHSAPVPLMVIKSNGNVGIGATNPATALQVNGTVTATAFAGSGSGLTGLNGASVSGVALLASGNTFTAGQTINIGGNNVLTVNDTRVAAVGSGAQISLTDAYPGSTETASIGTVGNGGGFSWRNGAMEVRPVSRFNVYKGQDVTSSNQVALTVVGSSGHVGIGTTTPARALTVKAPGYGIEHTDGNVRLSTYIDAGGGWLGTVSAHNLNFFVNDGANAMTIQTNGNAFFGGEITCVAINITSDRNAKEDFKPVNAREVLAKVARLPISEWQYKEQTDARHIGPMAQDFHDAFTLGRDEKHISVVDEGGVALAAIQGLNEKVESGNKKAETQIKEIKAENAALKQTVNELKDLLQQLKQNMAARKAE